MQFSPEKKIVRKKKIDWSKRKLNLSLSLVVSQEYHTGWWITLWNNQFINSAITFKISHEVHYAKKIMNAGEKLNLCRG